MDNENETIIFTYVPNSTIPPEKVHQIESVLTHDALLSWPNISAEPIKEFTIVGFVVMAFPDLFPTEATDLRSLRKASVSPLEYIQYLFKYKDGRFARNPRFWFHSMYSSHWSSLRNGKICFQRNTDISNLTAAQFKNKFREDPGLVNRLTCFNSSIRGRAVYWRSCYRELLDMVQQLGPPTLSSN
ncbi:hypothetical protein AVEN_181216-1 [Araneus ventricosus]|uniref:Uncharacterized protein n=1 Tax=Araneus ventricosus TaxID=182803 RepID=A0A4Y2KX19_ARAVE|nr:hypothetical protein AVEN_181216-1 [Araneus ventricosus]